MKLWNMTYLGPSRVLRLAVRGADPLVWGRGESKVVSTEVRDRLLSLRHKWQVEEATPPEPETLKAAQPEGTPDPVVDPAPETEV
jgi:hypothetical protein